MATEKTKVTIYDVASRANVAISTVSRVLNNSSDVSEKTRKKVLAAIADLKFRPDRTAKVLAKQKSQSLAVALTTFTTPFHNEFLKGVRNALWEEETDLLLCDLGSRAPRQTLLNFLNRGAVDGLLLVGVKVDEEIANELRAMHAPVVLVGSAWPGFDSFYWENEGGAFQAVQHLIDQGHTRIAMIRAHTESDLQNGRIKGYQDALTDAGLPINWSLIASGETEKHGGFSEESGYEAMQKLLTLTPPPTAVFASSDVQAIGAWKAIIDAGKTVPKNIAIVGYDDIKTSHYLGLSSVDQSMQDTGQQATEILLQRVKGLQTGDPVNHRIVPKLKIRRSSKI